MQTQQIQQQGMLKQQMQTQAQPAAKSGEAAVECQYAAGSVVTAGNGMLGQQTPPFNTRAAGRNAQRQRKSGTGCQTIPSRAAGAGQRTPQPDIPLKTISSLKLTALKN